MSGNKHELSVSSFETLDKALPDSLRGLKGKPLLELLYGSDSVLAKAVRYAETVDNPNRGEIIERLEKLRDDYCGRNPDDAAKTKFDEIVEYLRGELSRSEARKHPATASGNDRILPVGEDAKTTVASMPVLLVIGDEIRAGSVGNSGMIGNLHGSFSRGKPGCSIATGRMGLTLPASDFNDGLALASTLAMGSENFEKQWFIERHPEENGYDKFAIRSLAQRSCDTAFACLFWILSGVDPEGNRIEEGLELDPFASVTAQLSDRTNGANTSLLRVGGNGFVAKAIAAVRCGLNLIVVARGQSAEGLTAGRERIAISASAESSKERHHRIAVRNGFLDEAFQRNGIDDWRNRLDIVEVETAGEAFEELIRSSRLSRVYREAVALDFAKNFYEIDDEGNRVDGSNTPPLAFPNSRGRDQETQKGT